MTVVDNTMYDNSSRHLLLHFEVVSIFTSWSNISASLLGSRCFLSRRGEGGREGGRGVEGWVPSYWVGEGRRHYSREAGRWQGESGKKAEGWCGDSREMTARGREGAFTAGYGGCVCECDGCQSSREGRHGHPLWPHQEWSPGTGAPEAVRRHPGTTHGRGECV